MNKIFIISKLLVTILLCFGLMQAHGQVNQWTWISGDNTTYQDDVYGTKGIPAAANKPGVRQNAVGWSDNAGNFWLFGGDKDNSSSSLGDHNDLWKWDGAQWTWMSGDNTLNVGGVYGTKGVASSSNKPGARYGSVSWADNAGNLWLFGGTTWDGAAESFNDLWKYNIASGQWTWMSGDNSFNQASVYGTAGVEASSNKPAARYGGVSWIDNAGNLWLYGGRNYTTGTTHNVYDDLWKYNPATNQWTWMSGGVSGYAIAAVYGTKGVPASGNKPGDRWYSTSWKGSDGNLWLFGGRTEKVGVIVDEYRNDLWKYDLATGLWTWVSGDNIPAQVGVYGTKGIADAANKPGARLGSVGWTDGSGNLWLFGGDGFSSVTVTNNNDLWKWNGSQWTWMSGGDGSISGDYLANYGTKGVTAPTNKPGGRYSAISWKDATGNFGLFGGSGYVASLPGGSLSDMWKYSPPASSPTGGSCITSSFYYPSDGRVFLFNDMEYIQILARNVESGYPKSAAPDFYTTLPASWSSVTASVYTSIDNKIHLFDLAEYKRATFAGSGAVSTPTSTPQYQSDFSSNGFPSWNGTGAGFSDDANNKVWLYSKYDQWFSCFNYTISGCNQFSGFPKYQYSDFFIGYPSSWLASPFKAFDDLYYVPYATPDSNVLGNLYVIKGSEYVKATYTGSTATILPGYPKPLSPDIAILFPASWSCPVSSSIKDSKAEPLDLEVLVSGSNDAKHVDVQFTTSASAPSYLRMFDLQGKLIKEEKGMANPGINKMEIDLPPLASSVYIVQLNCGGIDGTRKIVIN